MTNILISTLFKTYKHISYLSLFRFPKNATVDQKVTILGGVFLINQLYFEGGTDDQPDGGNMA